VAFVLKLWYDSISVPSTGVRDLLKFGMQKSEKVEIKHLQKVITQYVHGQI
jgi:hypothetical protein